MGSTFSSLFLSYSYMNYPTDFAKLAIHTALSTWINSRKEAEALLTALPNERFNDTVAPGKNRGIYLVGHLIAEHDELAELLGTQRAYLPYEALFLTNPDRFYPDLPSMVELRTVWGELHERLTDYMHQLTVDQWFGPHSRISAEDFESQPHRNRLAVLTSRNNHFAYHLGQLMLLK
jgi:hypothetical protein